ncbi:hypothetical protein ACLB2K_071451 [Fragaria x ananassa]
MPSSSPPRSVEEIFKDYAARRSGIVRALTNDVDEFYALCDPEKENLCLYGHPDETWEVTLPAEEVPPELPEPALGINFARDGMKRQDWLSLIAVHSDSWLLSVSFYFGARLNRNERKRLFSLTNDLPTIFEVVTGRMSTKDKPSMDSGSKSRNNAKVILFLVDNYVVLVFSRCFVPLCKIWAYRPASASQRSTDGPMRTNSTLLNENYVEDEDEHSETLCGSCGGNYSANEFWIGCDICERWYHGKCVKITPSKAEYIQHYKMPFLLKEGKTVMTDVDMNH